MISSSRTWRSGRTTCCPLDSLGKTASNEYFGRFALIFMLANWFIDILSIFLVALQNEFCGKSRAVNVCQRSEMCSNTTELNNFSVICDVLHEIGQWILPAVLLCTCLSVSYV